jgi:hypothetical protein
MFAGNVHDFVVEAVTRRLMTVGVVLPLGTMEFTAP